jgi:uncharacterized membrane protein YpjA
MKKERKQRNSLVAAGRSVLFAVLVFLLLDMVFVHAGLGLLQSIVVESTNAFSVVAQGVTAVWYGADDYKGGVPAIGDLQAGIERVRTASRDSGC